MFWIGLADAQYYRKELSSHVAEKALTALEKIQQGDWDLCVGDLDRRRKKYAEAPMPERKVGKPRPPFSCGWEFGDTYAYNLHGPGAKQIGIDGGYVLFRTLSTIDYDKKISPIVTVTFWGDKPLPTNSEEFSSVPISILEIGGRFGSPIRKFEYRTILLFKNMRQLTALNLEYVGNFQDVKLPEDEIIFQDPANTCLTLPELFDRDLCLYWEINDYCTPYLQDDERRKSYVFLRPDNCTFAEMCDQIEEERRNRQKAWNGSKKTD